MSKSDNPLTTSGRIGTFIRTFTVPNLEREKVRLPTSTVVMTTQREPYRDALFSVKQKITGDVANPLVEGGQKLIPSVTRTFNAGRELHVFLQAYERDSTAVRPLVGFVTLFKDGARVFETEPAGFDAWDPKIRAVPVRITIPAGQLQPGTYDCQVTVLDPSGGKAAFWRADVVIVK